MRRQLSKSRGCTIYVDMKGEFEGQYDDRYRPYMLDEGLGRSTYSVREQMVEIDCLDNMRRAKCRMTSCPLETAPSANFLISLIGFGKILKNGSIALISVLALWARTLSLQFRHGSQQRPAFESRCRLRDKLQVCGYWYVTFDRSSLYLS